MTTPRDLGAEAVNLLYQALLDATRWPDALRRVAEWLDCTCLRVAIHELDPERVSHWRWPEAPVGSGHEPGWCCVTRDVCPVGFETLGHGSAPSRAASADPAGASPEIREWTERSDAGPRHCFAARLRVAETSNGFLCVRWNQAQATDRAHRERFGHLLDYLGSALNTAAPVHELRETVDTLSTVADQLPIGVAVLDHDAHLRYANRTVQTMLAARDGLCRADGALHAMRPDDDVRLRALISVPAKHLKSKATLIPRPSGRPPYVLRRISAEPNSPAAGPDTTTILLIGDPNAVPLLAKQTLRSLYGLTPTEARLARRLVAGDTVAEAAAALSVTFGNARTHLEHLFRKTATHRQSELIRLLLESPAAFNPIPPT